MNRILVGGIVKSRSGGHTFNIRCVNDEESNKIKNLVIKTLVLNGYVLTVENAMYDNKEV